MRARSPDTFLARLVNTVQWTLFVLGLSGVFHILVVLAVPHVTVMKAASRITVAGGLNEALHSSAPDAQEWLNARLPNRDVLTSVCAFNLALGPVHLSATPPDALWSMSIYSDARTLLYRLEESDISGANFEAILAGTGQQFNNAKQAHEIRLERFTGIIVFRSIIDPGSPLAPQIALNETSRCEPDNKVLSGRHF